MVSYLAGVVTMEIKFKTDDIVTVPRAAKALGRPKMTLYRWIDADKIVSIKLGGILFIPTSEIERLNKKKEQAAEA
jgi:excisionase family DNA binding protein